MSTDHDHGCHCHAAYRKGVVDGYHKALAECVQDVVGALTRIGCDKVLGQMLDELARGSQREYTAGPLRPRLDR
jgi:hypothetical protein